MCKQMFVLATQKIILRHDVFVGDDSNLSEVLKRTYKIILLKFLAKVFAEAEALEPLRNWGEGGNP